MLYNYLKNNMLKFPEQTISDGVTSITYKQLIDYAESFGQKLIKPKYGLLFKSELDTAKALMACLYANKTAVVLSNKYGELHNRKIIDTIKISELITDSGIIHINSCTEQEDLSNVALIMCTSGTTGKPKGAMITHENLLTNVKDIRSYFSVCKSDHILIARPLYHSAVLTGELLISLTNGLKIDFYSDGFTPSKIIEIIRKKECNVLCGTPTLFYHLSLINIKSDYPVSLRVAAISGECMTKTAALKIRQAFPGTQIYNVYGLTEASPRVSFLPPDKFDSKPLSVGMPLKSVKVKTVNNELYVKGKSIMKGYYCNAEATNRVITDGWLHTGDIVSQDSEGMFYIKSRKDNMIIRAGMNIYPQEIENELKAHPKIKEVLVYGLKINSTTEKINIKVVTKELTVTDIFEICKSRLPSYQMPDSIEIVNEIPKNASGKVIRNVFSK